MSEILGRDAILAADDRPVTIVEVPEWGGSVRLRALSSVAAEGYYQAIRSPTGAIVRDQLAEKLIAASVVGEDGEPLLTESDVGVLAKKNATVIQRLFIAADKLNTVTEEKVEAAVKN